jgi:putative CocE/NonD family hydrolase
MNEYTDAAWWHGSPTATPARLYEGSVRTSQYVTVRDGTRIAIDLFLPDGLADGQAIPTILTITPYFRSLRYRSPLFRELFRRLGLESTEWGHEFARFGYATVVMDMRGAGASFGRKRSVMMPDVVRDGSDVMDWIVSQPWSNGRVGSTGISALGMTGEWLATTKHPALKAIAPRFTVFDIYRAVHPGGLLSARFLADMGRAMRAMDSNRLWQGPENPLVRPLFFALTDGIRAVDDDRDKKLIAAAVREHVDNEAFDLDLAAITHRDDLFPHAAEEATLDSQSPAAFASDLEAAGLPIYAYGGWLDAAFNREMISLHQTVRTPGSRLVIGPWEHGARFHCSPIVDGKRRSEFDQAAELVRFFDLHLRDIDHGVSTEDPIHYFTMGEERWKSAATWPPPGTVTESWFLDEGGRLAPGVPSGSGEDRYRVDFEAGTGLWSRFGRHLSGGGQPAHYPDRARRDQRLLTYTSAPLTQDMEVTGHPVARIHMTSSTPDAALILYLEDVAPDGHVVNVTEGHLRLIHRELGDHPPFWHAGPFHTCARADAKPVHPGELLALEVDLLPVSWLFRAGHAVRLAVAGADKDNFIRVPADDVPMFEISRGGTRPSLVELPVMRQR